ncbi:hypothetical protein pah_c207o002 [Parachlamydia acanthamoebae str. Hall's coccus]|nr:hypothetical protein pah_c207o002 [Parachlamydia acanthamoebae str. Hall's coccus]
MRTFKNSSNGSPTRLNLQKAFKDGRYFETFVKLFTDDVSPL